MLTLKQLEHKCLLYKSADQCKYLDNDYNTNSYICKKKSVDKKIIDKKAADFIKECKKSNVDPYAMHEPLGDNCTGYPVLLTRPQGFDV